LGGRDRQGHESTFVARLINTARERRFAPTTAAIDKGYDAERICGECEAATVARSSAPRDTRREGREGATAELRAWHFDVRRVRCGARRLQGARPDRKVPAASRGSGGPAPPLIPRETLRFPKLYRGRAPVGREFARLKGEWALLPLRIPGLERVRLHAGLTILVKLSCALARARAVHLAALLTHPGDFPPRLLAQLRRAIR
jgi:hypothetical protein